MSLLLLATTAFAMPLRALSWSVEATGPLATIELRATFHADANGPVDAIWMFPVGPDAVVDDLRMVIGDRVIESRIATREQAREVFEEARTLGLSAALTEQQRPNLFTQEVANIPPGADIEVQLRLVQPLARVDGAWELVVPLVVAPRFVSDDQDPSFVADQMEAGGPTGIPTDVDLTVHAGLPLLDVWSDTHDLHPTVTLSDATASLRGLSPTRDLVVRWRTADREPAMVVLASGDTAMLLVEPPRDTPPEERAPREVIWVVDTSGSMRGRKLELARELVKRAIVDAGPDDAFDLVTFASGVHALWDRPRSLGGGGRQQALRAVDELDAVGTTQLWSALDQALSLPRDPRRRRVVVFLTDGQVTNEPAVLARVAAAPDTTVSTIGFGAAPNRYVLDEMARLGGGTASYATLADRETELPRLIEATDRAVIGELAIDWRSCAASGLAPARIPDLLPERAVRVLAHVDEACAGNVVVTARTADGVRRWYVPVIHTADPRAMASTWAREWVGDLERRAMRGDTKDFSAAIERIGLQYGIVTSRTSRVAVDDEQLLWREVSGTERLPSSSGRVVSKEFLSNVPSGRSYQSAVQLASGVTAGGGGNPNIGGGAYNENTYMLDGANITDPVAGTFSLNFNYDALIDRDPYPHVTIATGESLGRAPLPTRYGLNNLDFEVATSLLGGRDQRTPSGHLDLAGPLIRDKAWFHLDSHGADAWFAGRRMFGLSGGGTFTAQPSPEHRFQLSGDVDAARIEDIDAGSSAALARWQWFRTPDVNTDLRIHLDQQSLDESTRSRIGGTADLTVYSQATHDLGAGLLASSTSWSEHDGLGLVGGFLDDVWALPWFELDWGSGLVVPVSGGKAVATPRAVLASSMSDEARLELGVQRLADTITPPPPELGRIPVSDHVGIVGSLELVEDLAIDVGATGVRERLAFTLPASALPVPEVVPEVERERAEVRVGLRKIDAHRWSMSASWRWSVVEAPDPALLYDPLAPFVPGYLDAYRAHLVQGEVAWALPFDPWTTHVSFSTSWGSRIDDQLAAATSVWFGLAQRLDLRKGGLDLTLRLGHVDDPSAVPLRLIAVDPTTPTVAPFRLEGGLTYRF
ncbi:MAG: VWA domain-containing protein [Alphaproteobacteria bacterium]|nr:VWA domain-containing protein [Alphaproteobacteria bacterium]MCB9696562.1 VWA domain-containing protein [Alphaproteobacteria bacterium]